jgi:thiosulfate dehydrogenase [quinone] large subunit
VLLPLRAFLGLTFCYAGWQKFTDPQFLDPNASGYLGRQLASEVPHVPLNWLLTWLAIPHASFFGVLVAFGELLVGLATLLGLLSRLSASVGFGLNLLFWLTVTWGVQPYFLDSDPIYAMAWLTLVIAGPTEYSLDRWLASEQRQYLATLPRAKQPSQTDQSATAPPMGPDERRALAEVKRRALLRLLLAGTAVVATSVFTAMFARVVEQAGSKTGVDSGTSGTPGSVPATGAIGNTNQLSASRSLPFTLRDGDPGVVVQLAASQYVAYDATCTHAGCTVQYDPGSRKLLCPCHGAVFDPANRGAAVSGPTNQPLAFVPLYIDASGDIFEDE